MNASTNQLFNAHFAHTSVALAFITIAVLTGAVLPPAPLGVQLVLLGLGVITVGMPHGAMDHEVARVWLRRRLREDVLDPWWGWLFGVVYLLLAAVVILIWYVSPLVMLATFLGYSALHFGLGDQPDARLDRIVSHGLLPIILPAALHPSETGQLLTIVAGATVSLTPWVGVIRVVASIAVLTALAHATARRQAMPAIEVAAIVAANVVFEPLLAFGLYFVLLHSVRHLIELAGWLEPQHLAAGFRRIARECLPLTLLTCVMMAAGLIWIRPTTIETGSVRVLFVTLSALTVPHMLLTEIASRSLRFRGPVMVAGQG